MVREKSFPKSQLLLPGEKVGMRGILNFPPHPYPLPQGRGSKVVEGFEVSTALLCAGN